MRAAISRIILPVGVLLAACAATSPTSRPPADPVAAAMGQPAAARPGPAPVPGYLPAGAVDMLKVIPPAPVSGDARDEADRRIFRETRAFRDSARWKMASDDAQLGAAQMLQHFSCSLDIELAPQQAPKLVRFAQRATRDAAQAMARAKDYYQRKRPYFVDQGEICRPREEQGNSFDYPSGHATTGWAWGLALAQAAPGRATPVLARARAIGDSRVVCGVHNASAVSASRLLTGAALALASATAEYQQDLAAARAELAALRAAAHAAPAPARCEEEAALVNLPVPVN
jgi:acid phosphatase (class A)